MTLLQVIGFAVLVSLLAVLQKEAGGKYMPVILTIGGLFAVRWFLLRISPVFSLLGHYLNAYQMGEKGTLMLKALCVGYLIQIGGDTCRDLGAESIAAKLELCGRAELLLLALPTLTELLTVAFSLLS